MLNRLARYIQRNKRNHLNSLVRCDAKGAIGIDVPGRVAVHHLDDSNHQDQRNAYNTDRRDPC